jgi:hypothetical protein
MIINQARSIIFFESCHFGEDVQTILKNYEITREGSSKGWGLTLETKNRVWSTRSKPVVDAKNYIEFITGQNRLQTWQ